MHSSPDFSIVEIDKNKKTKKGAAMKPGNIFSLSLQKQIAQKNVSIDFGINRAFNELKIKTLLNRSGIRKVRGYAAASVLFVYMLIPFLKKSITELVFRNYIEYKAKAQKDVYYRFINYERFNWRRFIYLVATKIISLFDNVPLSEKVLIVDDTIAPKTGKNMELVSYHFDHKVKKSILGYQYLQLGYHNGTNFFPLDFSINTSSKRRNKRIRDIDKRTVGFKRRKEALNKKTDVLISMLERAWNKDINASFVLFDSWFAHDDIISRIYKIGYGVICRLKKGHVKYGYNGSKYTLKQIWKKFAMKKASYIGNYGVKGVCLNAVLPKQGEVRILFISDSKKGFHAILSTDLELEASKIISYYARRWSIEVFFKDAKQMLYLGKEQSNIFDATVACYSIMMLRYLLLVYILNKNNITTPIGPLFRHLAEEQSISYFAEKIWAYVKELIIKSSEILCYEIKPDKVMQLLDNVENIILNQNFSNCET